MHNLLPLKYLSLSLSLFLSLFFSSSSTLALTIPQDTTSLTLTNPSTTTTLNSTANANANAFTCTRRGTQARIEPRFPDCAGVLRSLPLNPNVDTFYNSGPAGAGDFQLPYFETYRTCQVLVELGSAFDRVRSSWLAVQVAALALNAACQDVRTTPGLGSAATAIDDGTGGRLKITLKGPG